MKLKTTVIFAVCVLVLAFFAFLVLPKAFPIERETGESSVPASSEVPPTYTPQEMISRCDTVITGKVIKADVDADGTLYTFQVVKVYLGRNYTSMGYAYLRGEQKLKTDTLYLFAGVTGTEKYHYYEPFENAPWVFAVGEDQETLTHVSNGDPALVPGCETLTVAKARELIEQRPAE